MPATIFGSVHAGGSGGAGELINNPRFERIVFYQGSTILAAAGLEPNEEGTQNYSVSFVSTGEVSVALEEDGRFAGLTPSSGGFSAFRPAQGSRTRWDFVQDGPGTALPATIFGSVRASDGELVDDPGSQRMIFYQGAEILGVSELAASDDGTQNYSVTFTSSGEISVVLEVDGEHADFFSITGDFSALRPAEGSQTRWDFTQGADSDDDLLPDDWELSQSGVTSLDDLSGDTDPDGDGADTLSEFIAGTPPVVEVPEILPATIFGSVRDVEGGLINGPGSERIIFSQGAEVLAESDLMPNEDGSQNYSVSFVSSGEILVSLERDGGAVDFFSISGDFSAFRPELGSSARWDFVQGIDSDEDLLPDAWELSQEGVTSLDDLSAESDNDFDGSDTLSEFIGGTSPTDDPAWTLPAVIFGSVRGLAPGLEGALINNPRFERIVFLENGHIVGASELEPNQDGTQNYSAPIYYPSGELSAALEQDGQLTEVFSISGDFSAFRPSQGGHDRWDFIQGIDSDDDQLPDSWELAQSGVTSLDDLSGNTDTDSDRANTLAEFIAGTSPTDGLSRPGFRILGEAPDGWLRVELPLKPRRFYLLQTSSTLLDWSDGEFTLGTDRLYPQSTVTSVVGDTIIVSVPPGEEDQFFVRFGVR